MTGRAGLDGLSSGVRGAWPRPAPLSASSRAAAWLGEAEVGGGPRRCGASAMSCRFERFSWRSGREIRKLAVSVVSGRCGYAVGGLALGRAPQHRGRPDPCRRRPSGRSACSRGRPGKSTATRPPPGRSRWRRSRARTSRVANVDITRPPITARPSGACIWLPFSRARAIGTMPTVMAQAVMRIGRRRSPAPTMAASTAGTPLPVVVHERHEHHRVGHRDAQAHDRAHERLDVQRGVGEVEDVAMPASTPGTAPIEISASRGDWK